MKARAAPILNFHIAVDPGDRLHCEMCVPVTVTDFTHEERPLLRQREAAAPTPVAACAHPRRYWMKPERTATVSYNTRAVALVSCVSQ